MFRANGVAPPERIPGTTWNEVQLHVPNGADLMCSGSGSGDLEDGFFPGGANILPMFETSTNDLHDADGDGLTDDKFCNYWYGIPKDTPAAYLVAEKFVKGDLDSEFAGFPTVGAMSSPGTGTFELRFKNKGTVGLESVVVYDIFPKIGDTGVKLDSIERKTEFTPTLASIPVVTGAPSNPEALIQYTTSANPCRNKLKPIGHVGNWPDGCTYDWSDTPPNPLSDATGIRVSRLGDLPADSADVSSLDDRVISYIVNGPAGVKPGKVAWNSFAISAVRSDGGEFLPIEPPKVGISPPLTDVEIAKTVNGKDSDSVYVGEIVDYKITVKHGTTVTVNDDGSVSYSNPSGYHFVFKPATEEMFDPATGETIPADPGSGPEPAPEDRGPLTAPATARDVVVKDVIPAGLELVPNSSDTTCGDMPKGSFDEATSIWTVGDIIPGQSFSLCYKAKVLTQGVHTNLVEVSIAGNVDDIDSTPGNIGETPEEDDEADAVVTGIPAPAPGINLKKQVFVDGVWHEADAGTNDLPVITQGQPIKYRFIVTNTGETYLKNVTITDPLIDAECTGLVNSYIATEEDSHPPGININGIHANPWTVECTWPYGWGEGVTINTASVTAESDFSDNPLTDENTAQVQVIIPGDHLSVVKSAPTNADNDGDGKISENDVLTYTITATNFGTNELTDVVVTDELIEPSSITCATVAPTATCVLTGTHKVTNAEATSGQIINTASADDEGNHPSVTDSVTSAIEPPDDDPNDPPGNNPETIPTLSEYALIILSIMLMLISRRVGRRRRFDRF